jgi:hypothetical protein
MSASAPRRPLGGADDRAGGFVSDTMNKAIAEISAAELGRQPFEEDGAQVVRHRQRGLADFG